jgi:hypothetical protein
VVVGQSLDQAVSTFSDFLVLSSFSPGEYYLSKEAAFPSLQIHSYSSFVVILILLNIVVEWVTLLLHIREIPGSYLGLGDWLS